MTTSSDRNHLIGSLFSGDDLPSMDHSDKLHALAIQVVKDMGLAGIEFQSSNKPDTAAFWTEMFHLFDRHCQLSPEIVRAFLYRVDIPESTVTDLLFSEAGNQTLFGSVLKREWSKIQMRKNYQ